MVVVGGGVAGVEALLALRALAGDRVSLTLVSDAPELVIPALSVAQAFALGQARHVDLAPLMQSAGAELVLGRLGSVDAPARTIALQDGTTLDYDALLIAVGGRPVAAVPHATTWWPAGEQQELSVLLRDLEQGHVTRAAFVIPAGEVWPLPIYELALMTAREVSRLEIDGVRLMVVTPEPAPLTLFGSAASQAVAAALRDAGVALETTTVARVQSTDPPELVLAPTTRRVTVDRVIALPAIRGPAIPGTTQNAQGFILVDREGRMRDADDVWAAGDAIAYPVKFGGLATQQADAAAAQIAAAAGAGAAPEPQALHLHGALMTGGRPLPVGGPVEAATVARPMWRPADKVHGRYLSPFLEALDAPPPSLDPGPDPRAPVGVDVWLPPVGEHGEDFDALRDPADAMPGYLRNLGEQMGDYRRRRGEDG